MKVFFSLVVGTGSVVGLVDRPKPSGNQNTPLVKVSQAVPFGDNKGNEKREQLANDIADQVRRDSRANYRISGLFESYEKQDEANLRSVRGDKNMLALIQTHTRIEPVDKAAPLIKKQVPLDQVQEQIDAQRQLVVDIHTPFEEKEKQDTHEFQKIRKNPNLQAFMQKSAKGMKKNSWDDNIVGTSDASSDENSNIFGRDSSHDEDNVNIDRVDRFSYPATASSFSSSGSSDDDASSNKSDNKFDWRKLSYEIAESAKENGLGESSVAASTTSSSTKLDDDIKAIEDTTSSSRSSYETGATADDTTTESSSTTNSLTSNMDDMNRYIAKFSIENPADVPKKMNPSDFTQDFRHSSNYGGAVISIPLSSQLQVSSSTSFLQHKAEMSSRIAPGVEEEVAKEKKWDVYLADGFRTQEAKDEEEVKRMKGRKEYGE